MIRTPIFMITAGICIATIHSSLTGPIHLLCFERLYKNGNQINSLLGAFQFYRQPVKFCMFYPESCEDGEKTPDKIEIVYNPVGLPSVATLANDYGVKAVCDAFINFIGIK